MLTVRKSIAEGAAPVAKRRSSASPGKEYCMPEGSSVLGSKNPLSREELRLTHAWWRAANYLSVGQIYLLDNPLLKEPLELRHIKPRLLGHWGTTPGLNLLYVHLNRVIKANGLEHDLRHRTRPWRPRHSSPIPGSKEPTAKSIRTFRATRSACSGCSSSSASPAAFRATRRPRRRARSTRAASLAMRFRMLTARCSTIRT